MCSWVIPPKMGLIEAVSVPTIWIDDIGAMSVNDGILTCYYISRRPSLLNGQEDAILEVILKRPVMTMFNTMGYAAKVIEHMAHQEAPPGVGFKPHLVR